MKSLNPFHVIAVGSFLLLSAACDHPATLPQVPSQSPSFERQIFTNIQGTRSITLVSATQCEINEGQDIILGTYNREANQLRIVITAFGTATVEYFNIVADGLVASRGGDRFLLPGPLDKERKRLQAEHEAAVAAQERERRIAEERKRKEEQERNRTITEKRDKIVGEIRTFFAGRPLIKGFFMPRYYDNDAPFEVRITGDLKLSRCENDPYDEEFEIPGHLKWLAKPQILTASSAGADVREWDGMFYGKVSVYYRDPNCPVTAEIRYSVPDEIHGHNTSRGNATKWNGKEFAPTGEAYDDTTRFYRP